MREADVVLADGELVKVSSDENADLFWGLKGGGGNFGIVTSLECALYPLNTVYGGGIYYPVERVQEILSLYARWVPELPDEMTTRDDPDARSGQKSSALPRLRSGIHPSAPGWRHLRRLPGARRRDA